MTTLEPEHKDILEKLNEIALEVNWGTAERVYTAEAPNGIPKQIAVIQEAMEEIKRLREQNKELIDLNKKKAEELTLLEWIKIVNASGGEVKAIDLTAQNQQICKEVAYDIIRTIALVPTNDVNELNHLYLLKKHIAEKYGVTLDEKNLKFFVYKLRWTKNCVI